MQTQSNVVLVLEDEPLIAISIEAVVEEAGLTAHTCRTLADALSLGRAANLRGAILDYWIGGIAATELAEILTARRIPFVLTTGGDPPTGEGRLASIPVLRKPYSDTDLLMHIRSFGSGE
jgi:DNA-binding NtrC family response regulator